MNYYVMNATGQIVCRNTRQGCREWAERQAKQFRDYGMRPPIFRIFYDSGTEPVEIIGE
jgi:hypothetical protein